MPDLEERFRLVTEVRPPELWPEIEGREPRVVPGTRSPRRAPAAIVALAVAFAALVLAFRAFLAGPAPPSPAATFENGKIAFVSETKSDLYVNGTQSGIFVVNPDGSELAVLVDDPAAFERDPAWSPGGTKLAFGRGGEEAEGPPGLYVANSDGSGLTLILADGTGATSPSWSADGREIVFESGLGHEQTGSGNRDVFAIDVETGEVTRLTDDPARDEYPALSPDGSAIAFTRQQDGVVDIYVMNADGTGVTQLTSGEGSDFRPAWSPDGTRIAFEGDGDIYVMNADGTGVTRLTEGRAQDWEPAWSPDGTRIAFVRDGDIYVMNADGTGVTRVTESPQLESSPAWQPVPAGISSPTPGPSAEVTTGPPRELTRADVIEVGADFPNAVVAGEGGIWVSAPRNDGSGAGEVVRLDAATGEIAARIPDVPLPGWETGGGGMAVGQGSVWVMGRVADGDGDRSNGCCRAQVTQIDPATNEVVDAIDLGPGSDADAWVDASGIWALVFTPRHEGLEVVRVDLATHEVVARIPVDGIWSQQIWVSEGAVWVNAHQADPEFEATVGASTLMRIDPATNRVSWTLPDAAFVESLGPDDGVLWVQTHTGLATLDVETEVVTDVELVVDWNRVEPFVVDETGGVWFFGGNDRGQWVISRLDPRTSSTGASVELGPDTKDNRWWIVATAVDHETGALWVVHYRDRVSMIKVRI